ncbi:hypothetical protein LTR70_002567 [Exophiala xenobiotica]|uniref:Uncharacterized protein n=1 Tax=Lithohypha guttulata TaxID=1690604 RepID=A0ABR0KK64_9EURO|nr:hypothetical protein LTR24_002256 [Lithohypha guttulata]KAK5325188.1 hypothetical protein LTR70_002567 [Exophiala xenobiotica]
MSVFRDLFDLPKIVSPYIFRPLTAAEIFLPHARPVSWLSDSTAFQPERDIPSLQGKVILVTGGNAGLGQETIYQLAQHEPAKLYMCARSVEKARTAINEVHRRCREKDHAMVPDIEYLQLDLADLNCVAEAAKHVLACEKRLDILVLNAGIMATPPSKTSSRHDLQLGTNHIGHFLLAKLLMPMLLSTAASTENSDVRVVTVSSEAYNIAPSDFMDLIEDHDRLCSSSNYTRYGISKAANVLFASELARRHGPQGVTSVSLHPGVILTQLYDSTRNANFIVRLGLPSFARLLFDDVPRGALGQLFLAAGAKKETLMNGGYYTPVGRHQDIALTDNEGQGARLWRWSEEQVKDYTH